MGNQCGCIPDIAPGDVGRFSSMTVIGSDAYVSAYNNTYGDLMIGHITPPGVVSGWDFVDGVPDEAPDVANSHMRGGISDKGDDVGRYTSIATSSTSEPIIAYYDLTHGALKFASFGAIRWHTHTVDVGVGAPAAGGDDVGRWTSMTRRSRRQAGHRLLGVGGQGRERHARVAAALGAGDDDDADLVERLDDHRRRLAAGVVGRRAAGRHGRARAGHGDAAAGHGGHDAARRALARRHRAHGGARARKGDGSPGIAYYDRTRGNLRYVEWNPTTMAPGTSRSILDGEDAMGNDLGDVGLYPSLTYDGSNVAHIRTRTRPRTRCST